MEKCPLRSLAQTGEVAEFQVHIIEQVSHKPRRRGKGRRRAGTRDLSHFRAQVSGLFDFELGDDLGFAFVEDLKVFLVKIADGVSLGIAGHSAYPTSFVFALNTVGSSWEVSSAEVWMSRLRRGLGAGICGEPAWASARVGQTKNQKTHNKNLGSRLRTRKFGAASLGVTSCVAPAELLIKTPATAG